MLGISDWLKDKMVMGRLPGVMACRWCTQINRQSPSSFMCEWYMRGYRESVATQDWEVEKTPRKSSPKSY